MPIKADSNSFKACLFSVYLVLSDPFCLWLYVVKHIYMFCIVRNVHIIPNSYENEPISAYVYVLKVML